MNRLPFTAEDREPDPELMLRGYERAALTLNFVRSLIDGGFADLHHPENWDLEFVGESPMASEYHKLVQSVSDSLGFFESIEGDTVGTRRVEFYTCHEGLHLPYEQGQTRFLPHRDRWYDLTTHFPWMVCAQPTWMVLTSNFSAASVTRWALRLARMPVMNSSKD
ncbi:MAG: hypothetical protein CM1200mP36_04660 [Gammaproteobacteria bacterium]|nr:MAG: hypothetical protein CM1200mP36_04660 [Gammaproteobacteria bacterium]